MLGMGGANRQPARFVHQLIKAGQHHGTIGKTGNRLEQNAGGLDGAGRSGGNEGLAGSGEGQTGGFAFEDHRTAGLRANGIDLAQSRGIGLAG